VLWVIDPIDGTTNFSRQQPNVAISIAAVRDNAVQVGVILDPLRDELFSATHLSEARCNGQPIKVSMTRDLIHSVVAHDWAHSPQERQATLDVLQNLGHEVQTLRAIGSAALALAWVAAGRLDAYWNWHLNAWDFAAGAVIIQQAGGRCSDPDGQNLQPLSRASACLASNGILHREYQDLLRRKPPPAH
jgi:myo-inositol-1(or 4)-monophosphatase